MFKKYLLLIIGLLVSVSICADSTLSVIPQGTVIYTKLADDAGATLNFQFKIRNNMNKDLYLQSQDPYKGDLANVREVNATLKPNCDFTGRTPIHTNGVCYVEYQAPIPVNTTPSTEKLINKLNIVDSLGSSHGDEKFGVIVTGASEKVHLVFKQNNNVIHHLVLTKNDSGSIQLFNYGLSAKTHLTFTQLPDGFTNTCTGIGWLDFTKSCKITYNIPANPMEYNKTFSVWGNGSDDNPLDLHITITAKGHFTLKNGKKSIYDHNLDLNPGDSGTLNIFNTGGNTITHLSFENLPKYFSPNDCTSKKELAPGKSCDITYTIPKETAGIKKKFIINGDNVDNSPYTLQVHVAKHGTLEFKNDLGQITNLNVGPGFTGKVSLENTGCSPVKNLTFKNLPDYFSDNGCTSIKELAPGESCYITYNIPGKIDNNEIKTLSVTGDNADNKPQISIDVGRYAQQGYVFNLMGTSASAGSDRANLIGDQLQKRGSLVSAIKFDFTKDFTADTTLYFGGPASADGIGIGVENDGPLALGQTQQGVGIKGISTAVYFAMLDHYGDTNISAFFFRDSHNLDKTLYLPPHFLWNNSGGHHVVLKWHANERQFELIVEDGAVDAYSDPIDLSQSQYLGPNQQGYLIIGAGTGASSAVQSVKINKIIN